MIKNKRLKTDVEKQELELFRQGQFVIEDEEKEDATAAVDPNKKVEMLSITLSIRKCFVYQQNFNNMKLPCLNKNK